MTVRTARRTVGVSPKAILAAVIPAAGSLIAVAIQWAVTGELDRAELVTALTGFSAALLAGLAAWAGKPGMVDMDP